MTKASDNVFPRFLISEGGSTATPAAGQVTVYAKADGLLYSKDDAGSEKLMSSAGTGAVATDAIWDAAGDLAVGTGANTAARLASGAVGTVLTGQGVGSAPTWATAAQVIIAAKVVNSANQSIADDTATAVAFDGTDISDPLGFHNPASNNTRLTVPANCDGTYLCVASIGFDYHTTGRRWVGFRVGGSGANVSFTSLGAYTDSASYGPVVPHTDLIPLTAGQYLEVFASQDRGGALNLIGGQCWCSIVRVGI